MAFSPAGWTVFTAGVEELWRTSTVPGSNGPPPGSTATPPPVGVSLQGTFVKTLSSFNAPLLVGSEIFKSYTSSLSRYYLHPGVNSQQCYYNYVYYIPGRI